MSKQWILTYSGIWKDSYIQLQNTESGIAGVGDLERATIFNEDMKKQFSSKVLDARYKNGFDDPKWQEITVYIGVR